MGTPSTPWVAARKIVKYPRSLEAYPSGDLVSRRCPRVDDAVEGPEAILQKHSPPALGSLSVNQATHNFSFVPLFRWKLFKMG